MFDPRREATERLVDRRTLLRHAIAAPFVIIGAGALAKTPALLPTAEQIEGPFYPATPPLESDTDLTRMAGHDRAKGTVIEVRGRVLNTRGALIKDARVELWQANAAGRYAHPQDGDSSGPLDAGFQGWGKVQTGADGQFRFTTVIPGTYLAARDWRRPPHLHFKIVGPNGAEVTTQTYFGGNPLNAKDGILQRLSQAQQRGVTIDFAKGASGAMSGGVDFVLPG